MLPQIGKLPLINRQIANENFSGRHRVIGEQQFDHTRFTASGRPHDRKTLSGGKKKRSFRNYERTCFSILKRNAIVTNRRKGNGSRFYLSTEIFCHERVPLAIGLKDFTDAIGSDGSGEK